jgi:hypothetical protein
MLSFNKSQFLLKDKSIKYNSVTRYSSLAWVSLTPGTRGLDAYSGIVERDHHIGWLICSMHCIKPLLINQPAQDRLGDSGDFRYKIAGAENRKYLDVGLRKRVQNPKRCAYCRTSFGEDVINER